MPNWCQLWQIYRDIYGLNFSLLVLILEILSEMTKGKNKYADGLV